MKVLTLLFVSVVCSLDSNSIRSSSEHQDRFHGNQTLANRSSDGSVTSWCSGADCDTPRCQNRPSVDKQRDTHTVDDARVCVRSTDCSPGLCCVRYLNARRCVRVLEEGESCLLRSKRRRNVGRCDCGVGLACSARPRKVKGRGVCVPKQASRKTRHSGKRRSC